MDKSRKNVFASAYKIVLALVIITGIFSRAGLFGPRLQLHTLYSFTSLANSYIFILTLATVFAGASPALARFRSVGVVLILITGFVYHFVLLPQKIAENPAYNVTAYGNIAVHYIVPLGMLLDWLLFDKKGTIKKRDPLIWLSLPAAYFIFSSLYGLWGAAVLGREPTYSYFFMDFGKLGIAGVFRWIFLIFAGLLLLSYAVYFLDHKMAKIQRDSIKEAD